MSEVSQESMEDEMAFSSEWNDELDSATNHWLPAYGYQQPIQLQDNMDRSIDYLNNDVTNQHAYIYLETIVEETSDDLRSESDYSGPAGWPDTDSDADSVIHVPNTISHFTSVVTAEWSGSERDIAVPKKRRRRQINTDPGVHDEDDDDDYFQPSLSSRSSSLIQFETLERQCETTIFRTTASSEPFSHGLTSSFSFDSLETSKWRYGASSPDSLEQGTISSSSCSTSSEISSDEDNIARSHSSKSGPESFRSLTSHRSYDSLVSAQEKHEGQLSGEFSQSLNNNSLPFIEEPDPIVPPPRGFYKTVECLTEAVGLVEEEITPIKKDEKTPQEERKTKRSVENLSEDSGFGEHIPKTSSRRETTGSEMPVAERNEDSGSSYDSDICRVNPGVNLADGAGRKEDRGGGWYDVGPKYRACWQSAPDLSAGDPQSKTGLRAVPSLKNVQIKDDEELSQIVEVKSFDMASRHPVVSTPNLNLEENECLLSFPEKPLSRAHSFKEGGSEGRLKRAGSRGSNVQITTSFINLTSASNSGSTKGVHFSPVVSEVSWRESYSDSEEVGEVDLDGGRVGEEGRSGEIGPPPSPTPVRAVTPPRMEPKEVIKEKEEKGKKGIGGFFHRFSLRRLSGRDKKRKEKKKEAKGEVVGKGGDEGPRIIPLHPPPPTAADGEAVLASLVGKPPLPPQPPRGGRRRGDGGGSPGGGSVMSARGRVGLLETDLDSSDPPDTPTGVNSKKARSLLDLGEGRGRGRLVPCPQEETPPDHRAKSMEFLLDKENHHAAQPPENELQKVGERVMSEHQLRVQRSLQRLNVPDWYKNNQVPAQGFLLKRHSDAGHQQGSGWQGLSSKTTSLSSLGSNQSATPRSPTSNLLTPSPTPSFHTFTRWSTSRLNSNPTSTSTSPCGSVRSSFNYRQPYLGWRSQERLSNPRTPAERLAAGILSQKQPNVPNLSEVHSSIKEVTSAIVHYVSGANKGSEDRLSPGHRYDNASSRSASPRGSTGRLCWLESSFVGNRPIDVPETPVSLTATPEHTKGTDLYLDLNPHRPNPPINELY